MSTPQCCRHFCIGTRAEDDGLVADDRVRAGRRVDGGGLPLGDIHGEVLEAGVGTGRNLKYYNSDVNLTAIALCNAMLKKAKKRGRSAVCTLDCLQEDATRMTSICSSRFDWIISGFLCCVLPYNLQILGL